MYDIFVKCTEYFMYFFVAAVIVFPWYIISKTIELLPGRQEKAMQKIIEKGHIVTAIFVKSYGRDSDNPFLPSQCLYKYTCNGKTYKYTTFDDDPPRELKLYYMHNPRKASTSNAINVSEKHWFLRFLIISLIIIFIAKVIV